MAMRNCFLQEVKRRGSRLLSSCGVKQHRVILGIETSCDDTGVAVLSEDGSVLSHVLSSQWSIHNEHQGVVPLLAARAHEENLPLVIDQAIKESGIYSDLRDVSAIAVTAGPGLALCLKKGMVKAKELAAMHDIPIVPVNHLEAHLLVPRLEDPSIEFPFLTLLVSGGHCELLLCQGVGNYVQLGCTLDDSVGEATDKVARMLSLTDSDVATVAIKTAEQQSGSGVQHPEQQQQSVKVEAEEGKQRHPGAILEEVARRGDHTAIPLTVPMLARRDCMFSFSGLKTQMLMATKKFGTACPTTVANLAAAFQHTAFTHLEHRVRRAVEWCLDNHTPLPPQPPLEPFRLRDAPPLPTTTTTTTVALNNENDNYCDGQENGIRAPPTTAAEHVGDGGDMGVINDGDEVFGSTIAYRRIVAGYPPFLHHVSTTNHHHSSDDKEEETAAAAGGDFLEGGGGSSSSEERGGDVFPPPSAVRHLVVCGGVAANRALRLRMIALGNELGLSVVFPSTNYCTDNGVMVAWAALERLRAFSSSPRYVESSCSSDDGGQLLGFQEEERLVTEAAELDFNPRWALDTVVRRRRASFTFAAKKKRKAAVVGSHRT